MTDLFGIVMPRTFCSLSHTYSKLCRQTLDLNFSEIVSAYILDNGLTQAEGCAWALNSKHHYRYSQRDISINDSLPEKIPSKCVL